MPTCAAHLGDGREPLRGHDPRRDARASGTPGRRSPPTRGRCRARRRRAARDRRRGGSACMNVSPRTFTSRAPSPRSASEIRNRGASGILERGRMKLDELEIGDARAGVVRERDAVAGRDRRIRRLAEDLAGAAGREQDRARPRSIGGRRDRSKYRTPATRPVSTTRSVTSAWLIVVTVCSGRDLLPQRAADLAAGGIAGVEDAPDAVRRFEAERQLAVRIAIEARAPVDQLADVARAFLDEHAHRGFIAQAVAGPQRVGGVQRQGCRPGRSPRRCRPARSRCCSRSRRPW